MEEIEVIESPIAMVEGEAITYAITWLGATSITAGVSILYRDGADYTSTAMSGSSTSSGIVQTLETITAQAGDGGKSYIVAIKATVDGNVEIRKLHIKIVKDESE